MASALISTLEKLIGTPRDGALLRYSLGCELLKAGEAVQRDPAYSAAWKVLGRALADSGREAEALDAWSRGIEVARAKGDRQAEKEMTVFARRLAKKLDSKPHA